MRDQQQTQSEAWDTWVGAQTVEQFMAASETDDVASAINEYVAGSCLFDGVSTARRATISGLLQGYIELQGE